MKKLTVTMKLEMVVPDDWEVVQTSEGTSVLKLDEGQFMDLTFEPLLTDDPEGTWTDSGTDDFINDLLDMVETEDVHYELSSSLTN